MAYMQTPRQTLGQRGEDEVAKYLERNGCTILERNLKKPWGEIDVVARRKKVIRFVEVKSGSGASSFFRPELNLHPNQKRRLLRAARLYLAKKKYPPEQEYQIDLAAVEFGEDREPIIRYYERAITE